MAVPFRIGVMQLTMEPLDEMLASRARDGRGGHGHDLARRGLPVVAQARDGGALLDRRLGADGARDEAADDRLGDHLAVHAPSGAGGDGRARRAGGRRPGPLPPRLRDVEDLPQQRQARQTTKTARRRCATRSRSCAACLGGEAVRVRRRHVFSASIPALSGRGAHAARRVPLYVAATAPKMQALGGEIADGLLTPSITTPAFVRYTRGNMALAQRRRAGRRRARPRLHGRRLDPASRPRRGPRRRARDRRHVPREQGAEHPAAPPTRCSSWPEIDQEEIRPVAEAMERGGRLAAKAAGHRLAARQAASRSPARRPTASRRSRSTATRAARTSCSSSGATNRHEQIRLFGEQVLPHFRDR